MNLNLLEGLNAQQVAAVTDRGPALLIVAGAGSGKTKVLTHRIAHLLANKEAWPSQILAITFTNKAANEMKERVHSLLGNVADGMWIKTFHSACLQILRREASRLGHDSNFSVYDTGDTKALIKRLIRESGSDIEGLKPQTVAARISNAKNELKDADDFYSLIDSSNPKDRAIAEIFSQYQAALRKNNAFDFDDLIAETVYLFRSFPDIAAQYQRRFRHILIDEYQDTNHAQYSLIRELTKPIADLHNEPDPNTGELAGPSAITVVGDSDQSIYAFRGADMRNIAEFAKDFPGSKTILLEQNYRSTQNILSAANAVISKNFDRPEKNLWSDAGDGEKIVSFTGLDERGEAAYIVDQIQDLRKQGTAYRDMAVLYRTNALSPSLEAELKSQRVPYMVIGGLKFYERKEIKDALAYLTAIANPRNDEAVRRILNEPSRGIGEKTELKIAELARRDESSFRQALLKTDSLSLGPKLTAALNSFSNLLNDLDAMSVETKIADVLSAALNLSGYRANLEDSRDPQDEARLDNLDALIGQVSEYQRQYPEATIAEYLADIALAAAADEIDDDSGSISLMTLHTAKGLEYDVIFLVGLEQGTLPHVRSFDEPGGVAEERRLLYVGMTRAKQKLYLSSALQRTLFGSTTAFLPSSFLGDIPIELIQSEGATRASAGTITGGYRGMAPSASPPKARTEIAGAITQVRDNGSLQLEIGDRIQHLDYGQGVVTELRGEGARQVAQVNFDSGATKSLVVKIAPIEKL
ncbi:MAG: AAA family ATPase [Actinobacteria bacterium]|jgi:DNA helicase-2/ATP-dependent DNA helicase PcrA|uniref:DNA 3'-5' helicase n=1 Tax=freshwater metagenome TaxID=449393 RepID=A0A6J6D8R1_9ZZZZ|nr:AAA family ATPase [Actinomycetota bacterium]